MPYTVPNAPDVPHVDLAEPDSGDYLALGYQRSGVVTGGTVTQSGAPSMTVQVAAADIVIDGAPASKTAGAVTLDASTANPRFDLVGWYISGGPVAIKGSPSNNPTFPVFDPSVFCTTAAVYVSPGTVSITTPYIIQKQVAPIRSLRRKYTAETDVMLEAATPLYNNAFRMLANGTMSWISSTLTATATSALELVTSLTIRQTAANQKALILKVFGTGVKGNNVLEVQPSSASTAIAGMDATGRIFGLNLRSGTGSPEGVVTADMGTLYINESPTDANTALYVKTTNASNTGWAALAAYVAATQAIPLGGVIAWPGIIGTDTIPAGYLYCNGAEYATATYPALSAWCATKFGTATAGNFKVPDYRGRTLFGVEGVLAATPGINIGASELTLSADQLPAHTHEPIDNGHIHPTNGPYVHQVKQTYMPPYHLPPNDGSGVGMDLEDIDTDHSAVTGITLQSTGTSQPLSLYQPSQSTHWLIKT